MALECLIVHLTRSIADVNRKLLSLPIYNIYQFSLIESQVLSQKIEVQGRTALKRGINLVLFMSISSYLVL